MAFMKGKKQGLKKQENNMETTDGKKVRKHIVFTGHVQGVGFRYRSYYVARARNITGWVKNNWDGSVEMEAQGMEEQIERMLTALNQDTFIRIDHMEICDIPLEEENRFCVVG